MIKVLIVDDHEIMRRGLSLVFEVEEGFELVGEASDGEEAVRLTEKTCPDVILMDIKMPKKDGIKASRQIKSDFPRTKILILTAIDEEDDIISAIHSGVDGYMLKNVSGDELTKAVKSVFLGDTYLHPIVAAKIADLANKTGAPTIDHSLTAKELLVLRLMAHGLKNKEIAAKLFLSEETIKSHVSNILTKLDQTDRMQAVLFALRHNLVELS